MAVLTCVFALLGLGTAVTAPTPVAHEDQVRQIAQSLRCPTCAGEDVADSAAPIADSMRLVIGEQVEQGRSPEEIRTWFAQRYGDHVLLDPPRRGAGWVLWAVPVAVIGLGMGVLARRWRRGWVPAAAGITAVVAVLAVWALPMGMVARPSSAAQAHDGPATVRVLQDAVAQAPASTQLRTTLGRQLEHAGRYGEAAKEYAALVRLRPLDAETRYRHAFALVRSGQPAAATTALEEALTLRPDHAPSLLLLGTLLQDSDPKRGAEVLSRFVELAPEHPATAEVKAWLKR